MGAVLLGGTHRQEGDLLRSCPHEVFYLRPGEVLPTHCLWVAGHGHAIRTW
jgi:hypothetical protein